MHDLVAITPYAIAVLLAVAAWRDVATRLIPDGISVLVALLGLAARAAAGPAEAAVSLALAAGLFLLLLPAVSRGVLGGGDVKLASALLVGLAPAAAWDFVFLTAMLGGVLGLAYMAGPGLAGHARTPSAGMPLLHRVLQVEYWRLRRRGPVPYAVAIASSGIFTHIVMLRG